MPPTIIIVPGLWEGPTVFSPLTALLHSSGLPTETASLASTGKTSPGNPTMDDDITTIRAHLTRLVVEAEKEVLLVCHSAGGFIGSSAMEGMAVRSRREKGLGGGVVGIVFLTAGVVKEGGRTGGAPFFDVRDNGAMYCVNTRQTLLSDLDDAEAEKWMQVLQCQPAEGWEGVVTYCGWKDVPSVYLICEGDQVLPAGIQEQLGELAGSRVERCKAGHMCMLTAKGTVVEVIKGAIERV